MSSLADLDIYKLPLASKELQIRHLKEEIRRLKAELGSGTCISQSERRAVASSIRRKEEELAIVSFRQPYTEEKRNSLCKDDECDLKRNIGYVR